MLSVTRIVTSVRDPLTDTSRSRTSEPEAPERKSSLTALGIARLACFELIRAKSVCYKSLSSFIAFAISSSVLSSVAAETVSTSMASVISGVACAPVGRSPSPVGTVEVKAKTFHVDGHAMAVVYAEPIITRALMPDLLKIPGHDGFAIAKVGWSDGDVRLSTGHSSRFPEA